MKILTLTGPSGSGKTTILNELCSEYPFKAVVTHTTRDPRRGEVNGVNYHFVTKEVFAKLWEDGHLIESVEFNGNSYGVSFGEIEKISKQDGKIPVLIVEPGGLRQIKKYFIGSSVGVYSVYLSATLETLIARYLPRIIDDARMDTEAENGIPYHAKRLASVGREHAEWTQEYYSLRCKNETDTDLKKAITDILYNLRYEEALSKNGVQNG